MVTSGSILLWSRQGVLSSYDSYRWSYEGCAGVAAFTFVSTRTSVARRDGIRRSPARRHWVPKRHATWALSGHLLPAVPAVIGFVGFITFVCTVTSKQA